MHDRLTLDLCMCFERKVLNRVKFCLMHVFTISPIRETEPSIKTALMCLVETTFRVKFLVVTRG